MNSTTGSENIYIHLKLIFAFAAQSSLPTRQYPCRTHSSRNPLYWYRTLSQDLHHSCHDTITVCYVQLPIDDAILCIINDVMVVLYWDTDCHLVCKNSKG